MQLWTSNHVRVFFCSLVTVTVVPENSAKAEKHGNWVICSSVFLIALSVLCILFTHRLCSKMKNHKILQTPIQVTVTKRMRSKRAHEFSSGKTAIQHGGVESELNGDVEPSPRLTIVKPDRSELTVKVNMTGLNQNQSVTATDTDTVGTVCIDSAGNVIKNPSVRKRPTRPRDSTGRWVKSPESGVNVTGNPTATPSGHRMKSRKAD